MWYSFFPADDAPEGKPLFVFMQGGPGASILRLWGGNTAPRTLDTHGEGGIAPNPHRFSQLGNLLYIDAPAAGFSYNLRAKRDVACERGFSPDREAAQYVRVLLRWLARHPILESAPVVFVAESYGGVRVTLMLQQLLHPDALRDAAASHMDAPLADEIDAHALRLAAARCEPPATDALARQFVAQVLIQAPVLGDLHPPQPQFAPGNDCAPNAAGRLTEAEQDVRLAHMLAQINESTALSNFVGVDVNTIRWLYASERTLSCYRPATELMRPGGAPPGDALPGLVSTFGAPPWGDAYYALSSFPGPIAPRRLSGELDDLAFPRFAGLFLENLRSVRTFATDARCDQIVDMQGLKRGLEAHDQVSRVVVDEHADPRVRDLVIQFSDGDERSIRFPEYAHSGHMVALHDPETFLSDVRAWLENTLTR